MEVHNHPTINQSIVSPWAQLLDLYEQAKDLMQDLENNPQNTLQDLNQLSIIAQQMVSLSNQLNEPEDPNFHANFADFLSALEGMKSSLLEDISNNPQAQEEKQSAVIALGNIFYDLMQGVFTK